MVLARQHRNPATSLCNLISPAVGRSFELVIVPDRPAGKSSPAQNYDSTTADFLRVKTQPPWQSLSDESDTRGGVVCERG